MFAPLAGGLYAQVVDTELRTVVERDIGVKRRSHLAHYSGNGRVIVQHALLCLLLPLGYLVLAHFFLLGVGQRLVRVAVVVLRRRLADISIHIIDELIIGFNELL